MEALILGIGDAFTTRHFGSSALVRTAGGSLILIDCPDPIPRVVAEATAIAGWDVGIADIHDIVLTHLHGDHSNGLESFGFARRLMRARDVEVPIPRLHAVGPVLDRVWQKLAPAMDGPFLGASSSTLSDYFDACELSADASNAVSDCEVHCRYTTHPIPKLGLKITDAERTLAWSSDTPFESAHVEWLAEADLIVHETNLGPAHTPIEDLNALPAALQQKMRLIHMPDDFDPATSPIRTLKAGEVLMV